MRIAAVRLFVEDVAAARSFYADLLALPPVSLESAVLLFDAGPLLIVEQADADARAEGLVGRFAGVSLGVSDIEALHADLVERGAKVLKEPQDYDYGLRDFDVADLDGNMIFFGMESKKSS